MGYFANGKVHEMLMIVAVIFFLIGQVIAANESYVAETGNSKSLGPHSSLIITFFYIVALGCVGAALGTHSHHARKYAGKGPVGDNSLLGSASAPGTPLSSGNGMQLRPGNYALPYGSMPGMV